MPLQVRSMDALVESTHELMVSGHRLGYRAQLSQVVLENGPGLPAATVFLTSYRGTGNSEDRPVVFVFNGGPGSASAWLQMGLLGPKLLRFPDSPSQHLRPPYELYDNPDPLFEVADLVFVDPVGTGFARLLDPSVADQVWSSDGDAAYIADVIRFWLRSNGRRSDQTYLLGESYGAQRAVAVAHRLACLDHDSTCIRVRVGGVVLISQSLAMINTTQRHNNDQGIAAGLPTLAALAWYHGKIARRGRSVEEVVRQAADFADRQYLPALFCGNDLPAAQRLRVAGTLAALTGIARSDYLAHGLALTKDDFRYRLLWAQGKVMDSSDGRFLSDRTSAGPQPEPVDAQLVPAVSWASTRMLVDVLGFQTAETYRMSVDEIGERWVYGEHLSYFTPYDYPGELDDLLGSDPAFKVLIAGGYYDTKASYGADAFLVRHLEHHDRVHSLHYEGGHTFYIDSSSRHAFATALRAFFHH